MLYPWLDLSRTTLSAWLQAAVLGSSAAPDSGGLKALHEIASRTLAAADVSARSLERTVRHDARFPVRSDLIHADAFVRVLRLRSPRRGGRLFLVMAPHSGYAAAVLSPVIVVLLAMGDVVVTEWTDARLVPLAAGRFGLKEQIEVGVGLAERLEQPVDLVAVSQSGPTVLGMAALLAERGRVLLPRSLAFLGSQLDPSIAPTPVQQMLTGWPREFVEASLLSTVSGLYPGAGRRVYPAILQLLALSLASPGLYAGVQQGLWRELSEGRAGIFHRQHNDLHSLVDVPGELVLDALDWLFDDAAWQDRGLRLVGQRLDLGPLQAVPVLTVEAGDDELVGRGQTHALHDRLRPHRHSCRFSLEGGRHYDLFTGASFLAGVAPVLARFYAALSAD